MKGFFFGFVQKADKTYFFQDGKNRKKPGGKKTALKKTANLACSRKSDIESKPYRKPNLSHTSVVGEDRIVHYGRGHHPREIRGIQGAVFDRHGDQMRHGRAGADRGHRIGGLVDPCKLQVHVFQH